MKSLIFRTITRRFVTKTKQSDLEFLDQYISDFEMGVKKNVVGTDSKVMQESMKKFGQLGVLGILNRTVVHDMGFEKPTPVQEKVIPYLIKERSVISSAETGTGKTASYLLPIISNTIQWMKGNSNGITTMIMCPTKELASQIFDQFQQLIKNLEVKPKALVITGKKTVDFDNETLYLGVNIIITTPGKVIELLSKKKQVLDLSHLKYFILDECDKMLDLGFLPDLLEINTHLPKDRCVGLFSATLIPSLEAFMRKMVGRKHILVDLNKGMQIAAPIKHIQFMVSHPRKKLKLLEYLIRRKSPIDRGSKVLIFTRTQARADRIAERLSEKFKAVSIHSDKSVGERTKAINSFKTGAIQFLVTTELMARGIDIADLKYVINFDIPVKPESYLHRVGRCGRAGQSGFAISFVSQTPMIIEFGKSHAEINEIHYMAEIEKFINTRVELRKVPGPWQDHENLSRDTPEKLEVLKRSQELALSILQKKQLTGNVKQLKLMIKKKKRSTGLPTLRNFQEGRYEDALSASAINRAKKRGIIFKEK